MLGWDVNIRDSDGHTIYDKDDRVVNRQEGVVVGKHVWIASHVDILKGVNIEDNCVIGYGSLVTKPILESNVVAAGRPAVIVRKDVRWEF